MGKGIHAEALARPPRLGHTDTRESEHGLEPISDRVTNHTSSHSATLYQCSVLLGYSDASMKGYAATIYLRVVHTSGNVSVHFVSCKTKVAPIKTCQLDESLSTPRLELCAAVLLAQSLSHIQEVLSTTINISQVRAWTDSSIVLSWLSSEQKYFKVFVTHRVVKIHTLVPKCHWGHVHTHENPADPVSRGLLPATMASSSLHWNGPEFLTRPEEDWPTSTFRPMPLEELPETKANKAAVLQVTKN